jgi:hypothetical protein
VDTPRSAGKRLQDLIILNQIAANYLLKMPAERMTSGIFWKAPSIWEPTKVAIQRNVIAAMAAGASCEIASIQRPCSRMRSTSRSTASASGMLNFTAFLPT